MTKEPKTLMPKLRFPEFRTNWVTQRLDEIAQPIVEQAGNRPITPYTVTTGVGLVSQQDRFGRTIAGSAFKNYYVLRRNDFAYNKSATKAYPQGYIARFLGEEGAVPNSIFTCFKVDPDLVSPAYLDYLFAGNLHGRWLRRFIEVSARAHGSLSVDDADLMSLPVPVPDGASSTAEQRRIAACLTSLDEWIAAEGRKLEALRTYKKGLTQELFPREGETRPGLRFPEFRDAPEWGPRELGPLTLKVGSGITPLGGDKNYKISGRPFIRSQNVGWGELILDDVAYVDEETHRSFDATELAVSDVLLNITGASIGRSAVADSRIAGGNVNQHVCIIRVKRDELNPVLLNQYLISDDGQSQIDTFQAGGNRQGLNFAQIRSFEIPLPPTVAEQQRIAACLSSLDGVITAQAQKLDGLRAHKKGLLQQLFPSPEVE
jgi:type I restriction enzyme S subunit